MFDHLESLFRISSRLCSIFNDILLNDFLLYSRQIVQSKIDLTKRVSIS